MKNLTTREFIKGIGLGATAASVGAVFADGAAREPLEPGDYIADPKYGTCRYIRDIPKFPVDVESATMVGGKVVQPSREIPLFASVDVVVVGGGPAGFSAALASARAGAKTMLLERYGSLGGLFTNGLVLIVIGTCERVDGNERVVTCGICGEFLDRAKSMGDGVYRVDRGTGPNQPTIDAEGAKTLMDRMVRSERNLDVVFHVWGVDVVQVGRTVKGVVFESKEGRKAVLAKCVVDCTGDGDVAFQAGAEYRQITHNLGFVTRYGNIGGLSADMLRAKEAEGLPKRPNEPVAGAFWRNWLGPQGNGLSVRELTAAEFAHRENAWSLYERMRKTPGFGKAFLMQNCSQIGVRASRLVATDFTLTRRETEGTASFPDSIGMSGDDTRTRRAFQIPYGTLLPAGIDNVVVGGRCIGVGPDVIDRVRLIPVCMVTGEAAGVAAALSARMGCTPRSLDVAALRSSLSKANVCLA